MATSIRIKWKSINLEKECSFERGIETGADAYNTDGIGDRFIRVVDVTESRDTPIFVDGIHTTKRVKKSDILLTLDGTVGAVRTGLEGIYSTGVRKVSFRNGHFSNRLLYFLLQSNRVQRTIDLYASGSTIKHASAAIPNLFVDVPESIQEQERVADILSMLDQTIQKNEAIISKYERVRAGMMQNLFRYGIDEQGHMRHPTTHKFKQSEFGLIPENWRAGSILDFVDTSNPNSIKPGPFGSNLKKEMYVENGFKVYGQEQVLAGDAFVGNYFVNKKKYRELETFRVEPGDVLLSMMGTIGNVLILPFDAPQGIINPRVIKITVSPGKADTDFFAYSLLRPETNHQLFLMASGVTMPGINKNIVMQLRFVIPDRAEQIRISETLKSIDMLLNKERAEAQKLRALKSGLMSDLLTPQK